VIDVTGPGHADARLDQERAIDGLGGSFRQLLVHAMHRTARLERDDIGDAHGGQGSADVAGRASQVD
jgi:hypothetical protein